MNADELLALPDDNRRHELVAGLVVSEPPASFRHGDIAAEVFTRLSEFVRQRGLGRVVSTETGFHRSLLQPSILDETSVLEGDDVLPGFSVRVARLFPT